MTTPETGKTIVDDMKLLTVRETCAVTRLSRSMVYKLIEQGILPRVRLPGCTKILIAECDLRRYIDEGRKPAETPAVAPRRERRHACR